ncbi:MAG TPA: hypothetical protein VK522_03405 [Pseudolabrys sp.]|nr:hypothetical protein [Pseudolabrys sp.]
MRPRQAIFLAMLAVTLGSCSGVRGPVGNDTGGIIPWSPEAERYKLDIAQANCGRYNQYAVIDAVVRGYGNYISYQCQWYPPRRGWRRR